MHSRCCPLASEKRRRLVVLAEQLKLKSADAWELVPVFSDQNDYLITS